MLAMPLPVAGERQSLLEYLKYQHTAFLAVLHGVTEEQARCTPTVSAFCLGSLLKHVTLQQYAWTLAVTSPDLRPDDPRSLLGMMSDFVNREVFRDDETLDGLTAGFRAQNAETLQVFAEADLDATTIAIPDHIHGIFQVPHWTVRWVLMHIIEEFARHAGHADIIRESIDAQRCTSCSLPWTASGLI
ncbi:DinB family protein [Mycobacterium sp. 1274761.0]|uniref:DinB family protein n=1 Tax=Mycobacterium sp. 1274761.0 TaxID=1834077 RepID=UPI000B214674|nr:DinB family protein [Mycobacterium sp. 1274761.0]